MHYFRFLLTIIGVFILLSASAQKGILKQANKYYEAEKYADALELYNKVDVKKLDKFNTFRRGVSNYYTNHNDQAIKDFTNARHMGFEKKEIYLYAAKALHSKKLFLDASKFYKNYLRYVEDDREKIEIINLIKR